MLSCTPDSHDADPGFRRRSCGLSGCCAERACRLCAAPRAGATISSDGRTAVVMAGAKGDPTVMVAAAGTLAPKLLAAAGRGVTVSLTGASGMWNDFNTANRNAMLKSELFSWP